MFQFDWWMYVPEMRYLKSVCHFKNWKYDNSINDGDWCIQYHEIGKTKSNDLI